MSGETVFDFGSYAAWWSLNRYIPGVMMNLLISLILIPPIRILAGRVDKINNENRMTRPLEVI